MCSVSCDIGLSESDMSISTKGYGRETMKSYSMNILLMLVALVLVITAPVMSEEKNSVNDIEGRIVDEASGEPLPNVILVGDKNECFVLSTTALIPTWQVP